MKPEEIKKALESMVKFADTVDRSVLDAVDVQLLKDTLNLINQYEEKVKKCEKVEHFADKTIATLQEENKRLKDDNKFLQDRRFKELSEVKAEAIKEFCEKARKLLDWPDRLKFDNLLKEMGVE